MIKQRKTLIILAIVSACVLLAGGGVCYFLFFKNHQSIVISESEATPLLTTDYLKETYEKAKKADEDIKNEPERVQNYFVAGMEWKTLGDLTNYEKFYKKALEIYEKAIKVTDGKNTIAFINAASVNILLKEFEPAEKYLQEAIAVSPGDMDLYLRLLELYKYYMKKDIETIVKVYDDAMKRVLNPVGLLRDRAAYFYEIGKLDDALKDYKKLAEVLPDETAFKERVTELELRLGK
jgi:tetratricopeptide (TPR) repeat protein